MVRAVAGNSSLQVRGKSYKSAGTTGRHGGLPVPGRWQCSPGVFMRAAAVSPCGRTPRQAV